MTDAPKIVPNEDKGAAIPAEKTVDVVGPITAVPVVTPEVVKK